VVHFRDPLCFLLNPWSTLGIQTFGKETSINRGQHEGTWEKVHIHILRFTPVYRVVPVPTIVRHGRQRTSVIGWGDVWILREVWTGETNTHARDSQRVSTHHVHGIPRLSNTLDRVPPRVLPTHTERVVSSGLIECTI